MPDDVPPRGWPLGFVRTRGDSDAILVLSSMQVVPSRLHALAWSTGSAHEVLRAMTARRRRGTAASVDVGDAAAVRDRVRALDVRVVAPGDEEYVEWLEDLADPPLALFVRGRPLPSLTPAVSVVGARRCTALGADVAACLSRDLASRGVCVVSGAARGIDRAAHEGALDAGGPTIAVLGCGPDRGSAHTASLLRRIVVGGAVVTEYPPGTPAQPWHFPARNRIIAALGRGVVVVEGAERSGTLITADHATAIGRDVLAVPGAVTNPAAAVPLALIRDGAALVRHTDDVMDEIGLTTRNGRRGPDRAASLEPDEQAVYDAVQAPVVVEMVATSAGLPVPRARAVLTALEIKGLVRATGGRFERRAAT